MDILDALGTLKFKTYIGINKELLKQRYRELAKEYHPDTGGDSERFKILTEANQVLTQFIEQLERTSELSKYSKGLTLILQLTDLVQIYKGSNVKVTLPSGMSTSVTSGTLKTSTVYISLHVQVVIDGKVNEYDDIVPYKLDDTYEIVCKTPESNFSAMHRVFINAYGKSINFVMESSNVKVKIELEKNVSIWVNIKRYIPE